MSKQKYELVEKGYLDELIAENERLKAINRQLILKENDRLNQELNNLYFQRTMAEAQYYSMYGGCCYDK